MANLIVHNFLYSVINLNQWNDGPDQRSNKQNSWTMDWIERTQSGPVRSGFHRSSVRSDFGPNNEHSYSQSSIFLMKNSPLWLTKKQKPMYSFLSLIHI